MDKFDQHIAFKGRFSGNGYTISNLTINYTYQDTSQEKFIGFFGSIKGVIISNITFKNIDYSVDATISDVNRLMIGGVAGVADNSSMKNVTVTGKINGSNSFRTGGLVGKNVNTDILDVSSTITIKEDSGGAVGGIVGKNYFGSKIDHAKASGSIHAPGFAGGVAGIVADHSKILDSHSSVTMRGFAQIGGLVGHNDGIIRKSYATGEVEVSNKWGGGLVGLNDRGMIATSYSTGKVSGPSVIGGLVGYGDNGTISNSYSLSKVNGTNQIGGLIGVSRRQTIRKIYVAGQVTGNNATGGLFGTLRPETTVESAYWDSVATGQSEATENTTVDNSKGLPTSKITGSAAKKHLKTFNFDTTWTTTEDYPALLWEEQ